MNSDSEYRVAVPMRLRRNAWAAWIGFCMGEVKENGEYWITRWAERERMKQVVEIGVENE